MIIEINSLQLNFQVFGSGPPLLVLHGWGDSSASWLAVAEQLSGQFQVFLIDLPGFGGSEAPDRAWDLADYRSCIEEFIREMELEQPFLLGHSHGGKIACELIAQGQNVSGLIIVASSGLDRPSMEVKAKVLFFKASRAVLERCGAWGREQVTRLRSKLGSRDYQEAGPLRDTMVRVVNHKLFDSIKRVSVPTLILWGSKDTTLPMEQAKLFRDAIPHSYIRILWDASHHPQIEQAPQLAKLVLDFHEGYEQQVLS